MKYYLSLLILLFGLVLPAKADLWLPEDPFPDRKTAEKFAQFLQGRLIILNHQIIRLKQVKVEERAPLGIYNNRQFAFRSEQDVLFQTNIEVGAKDLKEGGVLFYYISLESKCRAKELSLEFEDLPESFAVLEGDRFLWLGEALTEVLPELAPLFYINPPQVLKSEDRQRVLECLQSLE